MKLETGLGLLTLCLTFSPVAVMAQSRSACEAMMDYTLDDRNLEITGAHWHEAREVANRFGPSLVLPPHCRLDGVIDRRIGVNDQEYGIGFAINLPDDWNGRFLFQGGGGLNGEIREPLGVQAAGSVNALDRGFAVVSNDTGHAARYPFDIGFFDDQEASLNFWYKANPKVAELAKLIVRDYYVQDIDYSYFVGCSTGGREGMLMTQRYPDFFDGVVSGAPAMRTSVSNIGIRWVGVQLNQAAPRDDNGKPMPGPMLSEAERTLVIDSLKARCDTMDGAADDLLFNPQACDFDARQIACGSEGAPANCLAPAKAEAIHNAMLGPRDSRGIQVYPGFQYDPGIDDQPGLPGILASTNNPPEGPGSEGELTIDVDAQVMAFTKPHLIMGESTSVIMSSFSGKGGKQILYHGAADPWFSVNETIRYYEEMAEANGGMDTVRDWSRFFYVPGMAHCQGGDETLDSFDMLDAIVNWVEHDQAPEQVIATGRSMPGVSRPLCAWPEYPHYNGRGDINNAANYSCREVE
jgi:hypothetical protein